MNFYGIGIKKGKIETSFVSAVNGKTAKTLMNDYTKYILLNEKQWQTLRRNIRIFYHYRYDKDWKLRGQRK